MLARTVTLHLFWFGLIALCLVEARYPPLKVNDGEVQRRLYPRVFGNLKAGFSAVKKAAEKKKKKDDEPSSSTAITRRPSTRQSTRLTQGRTSQSLQQVPAPPLSFQAPASHAGQGTITIAPKDDRRSSRIDQGAILIAPKDDPVISRPARNPPISYVAPRTRRQSLSGAPLVPLSRQNSIDVQRPLTRQDSLDSVQSEYLLPRPKGPRVTSQDISKPARSSTRPPSSYIDPSQQLSRQNSVGLPKPLSRQGSISLPKPAGRQDSYAPLQPLSRQSSLGGPRKPLSRQDSVSLPKPNGRKDSYVPLKPLSRQDSFDSVDSVYAGPSGRRQSFSGVTIRPPTRIPSPILGSQNDEFSRKRRASSSLSPAPPSSHSSSDSVISLPRPPRLSQIPLEQPMTSRPISRGQSVSSDDSRNEHRLRHAYWIKGGPAGLDPKNLRNAVFAPDGDPGQSGEDAWQMQGAIKAGSNMGWKKGDRVGVTPKERNYLKNKLNRVDHASTAVEQSNTERRARGKPEYHPQYTQFNKGETPARMHGLHRTSDREDLRSYAAIPRHQSDASGTIEGAGKRAAEKWIFKRPDGTTYPIDSVEFRPQNLQDNRWGLEIQQRTYEALIHGDESLIVPGARGGPNDRYFSSEMDSAEDREDQAARERAARREERRQQKARDRQADEDYYRSRSRPRRDYD